MSKNVTPKPTGGVRSPASGWNPDGVYYLLPRWMTLDMPLVTDLNVLNHKIVSWYLPQRVVVRMEQNNTSSWTGHFLCTNTVLRVYIAFSDWNPNYHLKWLLKWWHMEIGWSVQKAVTSQPMQLQEKIAKFIRRKFKLWMWRMLIKITKGDKDMQFYKWKQTIVSFLKDTLEMLFHQKLL